MDSTIDEEDLDWWIRLTQDIEECEINRRRILLDSNNGGGLVDSIDAG